MRDLEDEMISHLIDNQKDVIERADTDNFDDEYHEDFVGLFTDDQ